MADASVIKEFLVALGFKIDEGGLKKFSGAVAGATKGVLAIGAAAAAAGAAVFAFAEQAANKFEDLYYASQRAGTTVQNLQALQFAFSMTGMNANAAAGMLSTFAMSMRMNPGIEGLLQHFGVVTKIGGKMRDTSEMMHDFVTRMKQLPFFVAARFAQMLGISPEQLWQMEVGQEAQDRAVSHMKEMQRRLGFDPTKAADHAVQFNNNLRVIGNDISQYWDKIADGVEARMTPALVRLRHLLEGHAKEIGEAIDGIFHAYDRSVVWFSKLFSDPSSILSAGLMDGLNKLKKMRDDYEAYLARKNEEAEKSRAAAPPQIPENQPGGPKSVDKWTQWELLKNLFTGERPKVEKESFHTEGDETLRRIPIAIRQGFTDYQNWMATRPLQISATGGVAQGGSGPAGMVQLAGYSPGGGGGGSYSGGGGAVQGSSAGLLDRAASIIPKLMSDLQIGAAGASGIAAMLASESKIDPNARGPGGDYGIAQLIGSRKKDFLGWAHRLGIDPTTMDTQYRYVILEMKSRYGALLAQLRNPNMTPDEAARIMAPYEAGRNQRLLSYHYRNDPAKALEFNRYHLGHSRGQGGVPPEERHAFNQTTNIIVHGATDPHATAQRIASAQDRVNQSIMRNLRGSAVFA